MGNFFKNQKIQLTVSKFLFQKILYAKDEKLGVSPSLLNFYLFDCSFTLKINWYFNAYYEEDKMNPVSC